MTQSRSSVSVTERGLIISIGDEAHRVILTGDEKLSLAAQLINHGIIEMRNERAKDAVVRKGK